MSDSTSVGSTTTHEAVNLVTIAELGDWCARQRAAFLDLFELLGGWTRRIGPGTEQRSWAAGCHRHAWHAELCLQRAPTVPVVNIDDAVDSYRGRLDPPADVDSNWYDQTIESIRDAVAELRGRIDPTIDPSTDRLTALLIHDLESAR